jgi:hypothetical protein
MLMKVASLATLLLASLVVAGISRAPAAEEQEMLWIGVTSDTEPGTTIAVTLSVARDLYESDQEHLVFGKKDRSARQIQDLIKDVLDGERDEGEVTDPDNHSRVRVWRGSATVPGSGKGNRSTLVVEIRERGKTVTTIRLPNITVETTSEGEDAVVETAIGWRTFLPFLAENGGAVYIATEKDDTEVWVYVE